jgi:hypothetical protein
LETFENEGVLGQCGRPKTKIFQKLERREHDHS